MAPDMLTCRTSGCGSQWPRRDSSGRVYCYTCRPRQTRGSDRAAIIATVEDLWHEGLGFAAIGDRVGLTKNAIVGIVNRLGLPKRRPWNARNGTALPPRVPRPRQFTPFNAPLQVGAVSLPPLASVARPIAAAPRKPPAPAPTGPQKAPERPAVSVPRPPDPGHATCQWIDDPGPPWRTCGAPVMRPGCAWCATHYRRAYVRTRDLCEDAADYIAGRGVAA